MCKIRTTTYTCGCTVTFRLSTCTGTYTATPRKSHHDPIILCKSLPSLGFQSASQCGHCSKRVLEEKLSREIMALRSQLHCATWGAEASDEDLNRLADAEAEFEREKWRLDQEYPDARYKKAPLRRHGSQQDQESCPTPSPSPSAGVGVSKKRKTSLLRREVRPEDVVTTWQANATSLTGSRGEESWGSGWGTTGCKSLSDELAEEDAEREAIGFSSNNTTGIDAWEFERWNTPLHDEQDYPIFEIELPPPEPELTYEPPSALDDVEIDEPEDLPDVSVSPSPPRRRCPSPDEGYESSSPPARDTAIAPKRPTIQRRTPSYLREQTNQKIQDFPALAGRDWFSTVQLSVN